MSGSSIHSGVGAIDAAAHAMINKSNDPTMGKYIRPDHCNLRYAHTATIQGIIIRSNAKAKPLESQKNNEKVNRNAKLVCPSVGSGGIDIISQVT